MARTQASANLSRRALLKAGGAFVVSVGSPLCFDRLLAINSTHAQGARPRLVPSELASYLAVNADGSVFAFFGKMDMGQGLFVAIGQMVAEELDVAFNRVTVFMGDSATSVNQGGASGIDRRSVGRQADADGGRRSAPRAGRNGHREARTSVRPTHSDRWRGARSQRYDKKDQLCRIDRRSCDFESFSWNGTSKPAMRFMPPARRNRSGRASTRLSADRSLGGDIAPKVFCQEGFVTDIKVPGMLHGRMIRPAVAGSVPVKVDEGSIKDIAGARVVWDRGFLGVVAEREWDAIRAAQNLRVEWSNAAPPFPEGLTALYNHIRNASVRKREIVKPIGNVEHAFKTAARVVEAEYEWPFQSHASMGPACAVVEIKDGHATCWTGSQKPHFVRDGVAATLGMPLDKVRSIWVPGPGCYGRNDGGDASMDAAVLAQRVGRPVRLQYTRDQGTGWDPKGPASLHRARAAIDGSGNVVAFEFVTKAFSRIDVLPVESSPADTLAGHFLGVPLRVNDGFGVPAESYEFTNKQTAWETIPPLLERASPLRCGHLRDPVGPQIHFASESFMDEIAAALAIDPIEFRLRHLKDQRDIAVVRAAAERSGRVSRSSPRRDQTRQYRQPDAAWPMRGAKVRWWPSSQKSTSTGTPAGSGRASSPLRTIAGRSSIPMACDTPLRATSCKASAAHCGKRCNSTVRR